MVFPLALVIVLLGGRVSSGQDSLHPLLKFELEKRDFPQHAASIEADFEQITALATQMQQALLDGEPVQEAALRVKHLALLEKYLVKDHWLIGTERIELRAAERAIELVKQPRYREGRTWFAAGQARLQAGRFEEAIAELQRAEELLIATAGEQDTVVLECSMALAHGLMLQDRSAASIAKYGKALSTAQAVYGNRHPQLAVILGKIGHQEANSDQWKPAVVHLQQSANIMEAHGLQGSEESLRGRAVLATALFQVECFDDAMAVASEAISLLRQSEIQTPPAAVWTLSCQYTIAQCLIACGKPRQAASFLAPLVDTPGKLPAGEQSSQVLICYAEALRRSGYEERAAAVAQRIEQSQPKR